MAINVQIRAQYEQFQTATEQLKEFFGGVMQGMRQELKATSDQAKVDMGQYESTAEQMANVVRDRFKGLNGAIAGVRTAWAQLAVVVGAGAFIKNAVDDTVKWTQDNQRLGAALGISATQASYLSVALTHIGASTSEYTDLSTRLTTQLRTHESELNKLGLSTRDANGDLKDQQTLVMEALEVLRGYKEGTDRNIVAQKLFGSGVKISSEMLGLNAEQMKQAKEFADALNLATGQDGVKASGDYKVAMADLGLIMQAIKGVIGEAVLPVMNSLAGWMTGEGKTAVLAFKVAIDIVISVFRGLAFAATVAVDVIRMQFKNLIEIGGGLSKVFKALLIDHDWGAAKAAAAEAFENIKKNGTDAWAAISTSAEATRDALAGTLDKYLNPQAVVDSGPAGATGDRDAPRDPAKPDGAAAAAARRAEAEERRRLKAEFDAKMEAYRGEEKAAGDHWDVIIEIQRKELAEAIKLYGEDSKQAIAAQNRIEESKRQQAEQAMRLAQMQANAVRDAKLQELDIEQRHAQALEQGGAITYLQLLELERGYELQKYEVQLEGLNAELELNKNRVEDHQRTLDRKAEIERAYEAKKREQDDQAWLAYQQGVNQQSQFLGGAIANSVNGMINRTIGLKQALGQIFATMAQQFIQTESIKLAKFIVTQGAMTGANLTGNAIRVSSDVASAAVSTAVTGATAKKSLLSTAASVFGKVYDAIAGIPYVGPFLAPVMAVAATGAVLGYVGKVASAEGGYDIPAGVNPLTQLHQREMVLPQRQADVIRNLADGEGGSGPAVHHHYNIQALDVRSIKRFFQDHAESMGQALQRNYSNR